MNATVYESQFRNDGNGEIDVRRNCRSLVNVIRLTAYLSDCRRIHPNQWTAPSERISDWSILSDRYPNSRIAIVAWPAPDDRTS